MNNDVIIIIFLLLILCLLTYLLIKTNNKIDNSKNNFEIQKISQNLENLLNKTLEQTGYVNSKISEIGDLTKKMTNAMTSNISDMGDMGEVILENILDTFQVFLDTNNHHYLKKLSNHPWRFVFQYFLN